MHAVGYHDGMVDAQYSGLLKRKKLETLVLANDFYHTYHDNLLDWSW